ncbi:pyruvate dehydrogenase E1 component subunit alpha-2, mitochondrial-like [Glycine soja]|uniref:pyruvate dehydrogenase E1 component subunit alpha-2, mitochondrial n=1 Tax=Glycine max TaxID=3847 RepID=UPI0003DE942B|nr:pyruvate dehydrogenase E1 component subunit alpha-2, mitochondrial [Glycine max]XP_028216757.1 pyruvate dehydrogenase E1 component subunit alpha-2, mitochondrial-like [Glycine soja]|eukprot:XP_025982854.1 pyruvate dehydrogenase E1 component subunit alpha-2, mitochondrial-like [Glycine max]
MPRTFSSELLTFFRDMALMRRMKIAADSLYKAKLIRGFCHLYDGQEAVAVGMEAASQKWTPSSPPTATTAPSSAAAARSPRSSPSSWAAGMGARRGRVPLRCGLAFAQKYSKDESVTFAMYGDGAANQGQLFEEALNIAALWDLPAILCVWVVWVASPSGVSFGNAVRGSFCGRSATNAPPHTEVASQSNQRDCIVVADLEGHQVASRTAPGCVETTSNQ